MKSAVVLPTVEAVATPPFSESPSPRNVKLHQNSADKYTRKYEFIETIRSADGEKLIVPLNSDKSWETELKFNNYLLFYSLSKASVAKLREIKMVYRDKATHFLLCPGGKITRRKAATIARALTTRLGTNNIRPALVRIEHTTNDEFKMKIIYHGEYGDFNFKECCCPPFIDSRWFPDSRKY